MKTFNYDMFVLSNIILEKIYYELIFSCYDYIPNGKDIPDIMYGCFELPDGHKCSYCFNFYKNYNFSCDVNNENNDISVYVKCGGDHIKNDILNGRKTNYKIETILHCIYEVLSDSNYYINNYKSDKYINFIDKSIYIEKSEKYYSNFHTIDVINNMPFHGYTSDFINFKTNIRIETIKRIFKSKKFCNDYE